MTPAEEKIRNETGVDLSVFDRDEVVEDEKVDQIKKTTGVDLSILDADSLTPDPTAPLPNLRQVSPGRQLGIAKPDESGNLIQGVLDLITGADRQSESTKDLPQFGSGGTGVIPLNEPGRGLKAGFGTLTSFSPERKMRVLTEAFPSAKFFEDDKGNLIVDATGDNAGIGFLNSPGFSGEDLRQLGFQVALFTPAALTAKAGSGILANASRVGLSSGLTQAGQDLLNQASGGEENVRLGNIDKSDVALATGGGAGFQALFQSLSKALPGLQRRISRSGVTQNIKEDIVEAAIELGFKRSEITDDFVNQFADDIRRATSTDEAVALQGEREFNIQLSKGQRNLDRDQLAFEDAARSGDLGEGASEPIRALDERQIQQSLEAASKLESKLGRGAPSPDSVADVGGVVAQGVRRAEETADTIVSESFRNVGDAALTPGSFQNLVQSTRNAISGLEFPQGESLTGTNDLLKSLSRLEKTLGIERKVINGRNVFEQPKEILELKPVHLKQVNDVRKQLNAFIGAAANPTDRRNLVVMKNTYDDFLDNAVKKALFEGDDQALANLRKSNELFSEYANKFRERTTLNKSGKKLKDNEGAFIEKIIADNPTNEEIVNALFGASGITKSGGQRLAQRLKEILNDGLGFGEFSDEWNQVRIAAFRRLTKTNIDNRSRETISGQKSLTEFRKAKEKAGSLLDEIFLKEEQALIRRYFAQVQRTQAVNPKSRENPSGSGSRIRLLNELGRNVSRTLGVFGDPSLLVLGGAIKTSRGFRSRTKSSKATRPFDELLRQPPKEELTGTAQGLGASSQTE